ncbi:MAG: Mur ligase family protein, partial [Oscillospiraceae bacterium]
MNLIWGMGREGNSTYNYLRRYTDEKLYIADDKEIDLKNYTNVEQVSKIDFSKYEKIYKSPGITTYNMDFDKSKLTSQTEVFFQKYKSQIIGVTGTKGKSTTSSLIYHILKGITDNVVLVGNIGLPCLDFIDEIDDKTIIVFELSCHQLEYVTASPHIAVLLNTYQDHLDHYGTYENYV